MFTGNMCFFLLKTPKKFDVLVISQSSEETKPIMKMVSETLSMMVSKKMMIINPLLIWNGISISFYSGIIGLIIVL